MATGTDPLDSPVSSLSMASRSLRRRKTRTALTVSGIVVGVALIMVLLSLTAGTSTRSNDLIRQTLPAQITVVNSTLPSGSGAALRALYTSAYPLNQSTTATIGSLKGVYAVSGQLSSIGYVNGAEALMAGIDPATYSAATGGLNIVVGSLITNSSGDQVVLGQTLANLLGATVGSTVTVRGNATGGAASYAVVGIFSSGNAALDRSVYVSLPDAQALSGDQGKVTEIYVKVEPQSNVTTIAQEIDSGVAGVRVVTATNLVNAVSSLTGTLTSAFTVIGLVALLAGGFGVVNTMMVSVGERTREIGTLKAIGARQSQIMKIFLGEALLIGVLGAVIGVVIGAAASYAIPAFTGAASAGGGGLGRAGLRGFFGGALTTSISPELVLASLALGVGVGLLAGLYPAWRASNMDPVEALRHV